MNAFDPDCWDREPIPLSALQHWLFCPRQCGLIHLEQIWLENRWTAEGRQLHGQMDQNRHRLAAGVRLVTGLAVGSRKLGLVGVADMVEFHPRRQGGFLPYPVEYKRGRPKEHDADRVQLCAQAMALEEMNGVAVPEGALFYGQKRRREVVVFDAKLRQLTAECAAAVHEMMAERVTPAASYDRRCEACSLITVCLPKKCGATAVVADYFRRNLDDSP